MIEIGVWSKHVSALKVYVLSFVLGSIDIGQQPIYAVDDVILTESIIGNDIVSQVKYVYDSHNQVLSLCKSPTTDGTV